VAELISASDDSLMELAADRLADELLRIIDERGRARLAVPGGSALAPLGGARKRLGDAWHEVLLTWVDERCVPVDDADSNRGDAYRKGALDEEHACAHELPLWLDDESPESAIARVEAGLDDHFDGGLDLCLFGMGPDGHIASLFPGHAVLSDAPAGRRVALVEDSPKPPPRRMTLLLPFLATASQHILVASGDAKRVPLRRILRGDPSLPASHLSPLTIITSINLDTDQ
jgi:6-phosphogluconolactonase